MVFRDLRADEIDCRVSTVSEKGCSLLLYKDARCDMIILDETVGPENWQRSHSRDNANCTVSIWDDGKKQWISKEDTGTESFTEKEKGLASDSFKRACFNWGIGRELYTAPFIWVPAGSVRIAEKNGKKTTNDKFRVVKLKIMDKKITDLQIKNDSIGKVVYWFGENGKQADRKESQPRLMDKQYDRLYDYCADHGIDPMKVAAKYKVADISHLSEKAYNCVLDPQYLAYFRQSCGGA